jgi:hypothetical protein
LTAAALVPDRSGHPARICAWGAGLALLLLAACRTSETFADSPAALPPALPITLSTELCRIKEKSTFPGYKINFKVHYLLRQLFASKDGAAFMSLVKSKLDVEGPARPWPTSYSLAVDLQRNGKIQRIEALGRGVSEESPVAAGRAAVEACVFEVYRKSAELLQSGN